MSEKMQSWPDSFYATEEFFRSIIYVVVKVQNSWRRRVGNENICIIGNTGIVLWLTVSYAVTLEHRNTIEPQTFDFCSGIAQIMHIVVEALNGGAIKAVIMVAANENQFRKSNASCSLPFMVKSPEWTTMSADGKSCIRLWQPCVSEICNILMSTIFILQRYYSFNSTLVLLSATSHNLHIDYLNDFPSQPSLF